MSETLLDGPTPATADTGPEVTPLGEGRMVREDCWREVHRLFHVERRSKSEIARRLQLDRKTVRGVLDETSWQPYARAERAALIGSHDTVPLLRRSRRSRDCHNSELKDCAQNRIAQPRLPRRCR